jgi:branched-chain amino acid transport system ATP-binding protein
VSVAFGGTRALDDVAFTVGKRELLCVIGPNGAGKSTLLNAVSGFVAVQPGARLALTGGKELGRSPRAVSRQGVGRSFQDPPLIDNLTALENVQVGEHCSLGYGAWSQVFRPRRAGIRERASARRCTELLDVLGVADLAGRPAGSFSYGKRKLIDIARAVVGARTLLLLDEPTSGLDVDEQVSVARTLKDLRESMSIAIVVVEHHMNVVRIAATSVMELAAGSVIRFGPVSEVLGDQSA